MSTVRLSKGIPVLLFALYWIILWSIGGLRSEHFTMPLVFLALYYSGPKFRPVALFLVPFVLTGIIYDSQRHYTHLLRGMVHVVEPFEFDLKYFGIPSHDGLLTPNQWWQRNTHPVLDIISGIVYLIFIPQFMLVSAYFAVKRKTFILPWSFLAVNIIGYITYHLYAAAPPWYASLYGFGPVFEGVLPNPAGCLRFDQLFGVQVFQKMYSKSADVFGAIPSLHVAYPLLATYFSFRFRKLRLFCTSFYVLMCFSAVYLNHHYILDVIWGSGYALLIASLMDAIQGSHHAKKLFDSGVVSKHRNQSKSNQHEIFAA